MGASVFFGSKVKTYTGLKKSDLMKSKTGKIVTRKSHAAGLKAYKQIKGWTAAVQKARKELGAMVSWQCGRALRCTRRPRPSTALEALVLASHNTFRHCTVIVLTQAQRRVAQLPLLWTFTEGQKLPA